MYSPLLDVVGAFHSAASPQRQEITSPLINDSPLLSKGPMLHDPSAGSAIHDGVTSRRIAQVL